MVKFILCIFLFATPVQAGWFGPDNYDECVLKNIKNAQSDIAASLVRKSCANKFYDTSPEGVAQKERMKEEEEKHSREQEQAELEKQAKQVGPMVNIDTFFVNLSDDQENHNLMASITLELDSEEVLVEINSRMQQVKDSVLLLLGGKKFNEIFDLQGKIQLRAELIDKINSILLKGSVKRIYFTDFVIQ